VGVCVERSPEMVVGLLGLDDRWCVSTAGSELSSRAARLHNRRREGTRSVDQPLAGRCAPGAVGPNYTSDENSLQIAEEAASEPIDEVDPESLAYVIYTSGSTASRKECC